MYSMRTAFKLEFFSGGPTSATKMVSIMDGLGAYDAKESGAAKADELSGLATKLSHLSLDPALKGKFQVRMEGRGLVISLAEAGFFNSGSATVRPDAVDALVTIAKTANDPSVRITIEGHTDNVPIRSGKYGSNWELSTARAASVVSLFIEQGKIDATRLAAAGYGEFKPIASNDTPEGRARNRRVDIVLAPAAADLPVSEEPAPNVTTGPTKLSLNP
jgi:chemotaxis protein MotB